MSLSRCCRSLVRVVLRPQTTQARCIGSLPQFDLCRGHKGIQAAYPCARGFHASSFYREGAAPSTFLDKTSVTDRVIEVVKNFEKVDPTKVVATARWVEDLALDSLDAVEVVMAIEDEFAIEIPDAEADAIKSVEDAVNFLISHPHAK